MGAGVRCIRRAPRCWGHSLCQEGRRQSCPPITGARAASLPCSVSTPSVQGDAVVCILLVQKQALKAEVTILRSQSTNKESRSEPRLLGASARPPDLCILLPKWLLRK